MDIRQASVYFDTVQFQNYDFASETWTGSTFVAQFKESDDFLTIYNAPTRKRMLYCAPGQRPTSPVVRLLTTGEVFMVGALQEDTSFHNTHYRDVYSLHKPQAEAVIIRKTPEGPPSNPGWAIERVVQRTFADVQLRSLDENDSNKVFTHGHMIVILPSNTTLEPHDVVRVSGQMGQDYFVLERYMDSFLVGARAVARGDDRSDIVYRQHTGDLYVAQNNIKQYTNRNVTARIKYLGLDEGFEDLSRNAIQAMVRADFLGVTPRIDDVLIHEGREYTAKNIVRDVSSSEWQITCVY